MSLKYYRIILKAKIKGSHLTFMNISYSSKIIPRYLSLSPKTPGLWDKTLCFPQLAFCHTVQGWKQGIWFFLLLGSCPLPSQIRKASPQLYRMRALPKSVIQQCDWRKCHAKKFKSEQCCLAGTKTGWQECPLYMWVLNIFFGLTVPWENLMTETRNENRKQSAALTTALPVKWPELSEHLLF